MEISENTEWSSQESNARLFRQIAGTDVQRVRQAYFSVRTVSVLAAILLLCLLLFFFWIDSRALRTGDVKTTFQLPFPLIFLTLYEQNYLRCTLDALRYIIRARMPYGRSQYSRPEINTYEIWTIWRCFQRERQSARKLGFS